MNDTQIPNSQEEVRKKEVGIVINNNNEDNTKKGEKKPMSRYYQVYNSRLGKWVKIDSETGLIVGVKKSQGEYENLPKTQRGKVKKKKSFWDFF